MQQQQATYSEVSAGLASLGESFAQLVLEVLAIADRVLDVSVQRVSPPIRIGEHAAWVAQTAVRRRSRHVFRFAR